MTWRCYDTSTDLTPKHWPYAYAYIYPASPHDINHILSPRTLTVSSYVAVGTYYDTLYKALYKALYEALHKALHEALHKALHEALYIEALHKALHKALHEALREALRTEALHRVPAKFPIASTRASAKYTPI
jgi:hypothetical protein